MSAPPVSKKSKIETEVDEDAVPEEIEDQCLNCHYSLANLENLIKPLITTTRATEDQQVIYYIIKVTLTLLF